VDIYITNHSFYAVYEYLLTQDVALTVFQNCPMKLVDNYRHQIIADKIKKARRFVPTLRNMSCNARDYGDETDFRGLLKGETLMTKWSTMAWFPQLWYKTSAVVLIGARYIAMTVPTVGQPLTWTKLFPSNDMGLMLPRYAADVAMPDTKCFHQLFRTYRSGALYFPRPFTPNIGPPTSTAVVKTPDRNIHSHSSDPTSRGTGLAPLSAKVFKAKLGNENSAKKLETTVAVGIPCPLILDCASTIHYAQGGTYSKSVYLDLRSMAGLRKGGQKTILVIDATTAAVLVGLTRCDDAANVVVGNVDFATKLFVREQCGSSAGRVVRRAGDHIRTRYDWFR
jgi:hypothetical protein